MPYGFPAVHCFAVCYFTVCYSAVWYVAALPRYARLRSHRVEGFSLIELMVALAIAAIIAVFTVPSYRDHVLRSRIPEATSGLLLTGMRLEQHYQDHRSYANAASNCGVALPPAGQFTFTCTLPADGQSYLLTATGRGDSSMASFGYTLDHRGAQRTTALPADWGTVPADCWIEKRQASC